MPKFEMNTFMDYSTTPNKEKQELAVVPEEGDVRMDHNGNLQHYTGYWTQIGNIQNLFNDCYTTRATVDIIELKQKQMEDRIAELQRNRDLETEFPDLAAAGEYCEELRVMLKKANQGYNKMIAKTLEKKKIFETLQIDTKNEEDNPV